MTDLSVTLKMETVGTSEMSNRTVNPTEHHTHARTHAHTPHTYTHANTHTQTHTHKHTPKHTQLHTHTKRTHTQIRGAFSCKKQLIYDKILRFTLLRHTFNTASFNNSLKMDLFYSAESTPQTQNIFQGQNRLYCSHRVSPLAFPKRYFSPLDFGG
jgi:hypothetical protein